MITVQRLLVSKAWFIEAHPAMLAAAQLHITSTLNRCKTLTDVPHIKTSFMPVIRHLFIDVQQVKTSKLWFRQYERTFRSMPQLSTLELEYTPALPRKYIRTVFKVVDVDDECNPDEKGIKHIQQFASDLVMKKRHIPYSQGLEVMVNLWIELEKAFHLIIRSRMEARRPADSAGVTSATWVSLLYRHVVCTNFSDPECSLPELVSMTNRWHCWMAKGKSS